ncbi:Activator of Hsp90 ATPase 1 family protein [Fimbriimonas ginsengisoli Gsoil 348]|uniref:Activator of Hsp90 ATPase 1 family protein n=1 Tax=Fimbriimonas ginsengisoli Gsoil 348 TaxID=661478 RepID=A0A068NUU9_FIMGI|nr:Activator of Hsp90 ATPase 1 family protein [Fimbriimonas ginsengisoli Gsoil 348]
MYVTYIKTTPEALWQALTHAEFSESYWFGLRVEVGSKVGDRFETRNQDGTVWDEGEVLVYDRPSRLSYSFEPSGEPPSRVDFLLEPFGEVVRLTLTHRFTERTKTFDEIGIGWPPILSGLKSLLEANSTLGTVPLPIEGPRHDISGRERIFVTYIKAPAERIWQALTDGEFTKQYMFGRRAESDLKPGSKFNYWFDDGHGLDVTGDILEIDAPHRLVMTWQVVSAEEFRNLPPSRVTYEIDSFVDFCRLTVVEQVPDEIPEKYLEGGKKGWPVILSGLKSLLETGQPLPAIDMKG